MTAAVFFTRMVVGIHGDAHLLQHVSETLRGEQRLLPVASALQSDDDAVTNQLILADSFQRDQFLEPRRRANRRRPEAATAAPAISNE